MSCRHGYSLPHPPDMCLDCESLAPDKCAMHHPVHEQHNIGIRTESGQKGERIGWYCWDCTLWGTEWERVPLTQEERG